MKIRILILTAVLGACCGRLNAEDGPFKNEKDKFSYALGMNYGFLFSRQEIDVDLDNLMRGIKDVVSSNKTTLTEEQMRQVLNDAQRQMMAKREEKRKVQAEENLKKANDFLTGNKSKDGVKTTESGLQYKILSEGAGPMPSATDTVTVNYKGTLLDGTEFDSSYKRGQPASFAVNAVIKGWSEALQMMKTGSKWELFIPPNLAYGEGGRPNIPPNSLLHFEVELLSNAAPPAVQSQPLTSDIIKVPSLEEMKKGAKIETIKAEDLDKEIKKQQEQQKQQQPETK